jgi:cellulose synthase/poly-beta-1,6-N-acetylglucosamine synthase-like glycosyltransferase
VVFFISLFGLNLTIWTLVGALRYGHERVLAARPDAIERELAAMSDPARARAHVSRYRVAVLTPAHNEELVIADTVRAIARLVSFNDIHVVSDGSRDGTAAIARREGAKVLEYAAAKGKAKALRAGMQEFNLLSRYEAILLLDADTRLDSHYFDHALPLFDDPGIVAVAGCASTVWHPQNNSFVGNVLAAHRERVYFSFQRFIKYGQSWGPANVVPIVPGFASLYRTSVLDRINIDAPGLVIEDFNMTFDLHRHKLGRIGFTPKAIAYTQDPHQLRDYRRQVERWTLGFWQTVRRHGVWVSRFWAALVLMIFEILSSAVALLISAAGLLALLLGTLAHLRLGGLGLFAGSSAFVGRYLDYPTIFLGIVLPDYLLTCVVAARQRRISYLLFGIFFVPLRFLDGVTALVSLWRALWVRSTGQWVSPERRQPVEAATQSVAG